jgi:hypothetical protein
MTRKFDFYEYAGVIVPGAVLILGFAWLYPDVRYLYSKDGLTVGEFGLFVVVSYAAGQLIQGIGNLLERPFWWLARGLPSTRIIQSGAYLVPHQHKLLLEALKADFGMAEADLKKHVTSKQLPVVRNINAAIAEAKKSQRADIFLGNYGLTRGLAAAFFVLFLAEAFTLKTVLPATILAVLFLLALQRMHRFGRHYATEVVTQYLALNAVPKS